MDQVTGGGAERERNQSGLDVVPVRRWSDDRKEDQVVDGRRPGSEVMMGIWQS